MAGAEQDILFKLSDGRQTICQPAPGQQRQSCPIESQFLGLLVHIHAIHVEKKLFLFQTINSFIGN